MKHPSPRIKNKKASFDYNILDSYEAGIVLRGEEVKAIRTQGMDLSGAYVFLRNNHVFLVGATIPQYKYSSNPNYDAQRDRELLLTLSEIERLQKESQTKGIAIIPLEGFFKHNLFKIKIGIGKGKKKYDKRETIKKREAGREVKKQLGRS